MRRPLHATVLLLALISTVPVIAQQQKQPWSLTLDERIALLTNSQLARQRVHDDRSVQASSTRSATAQLGTIVDSFDGKTHPELFLPYQVFEELIRLAFTGPQRFGLIIRDGFMPEIKRYGLPADFWLRLQSLSTIYVADLGALQDIQTGLRQQSGLRRQRSEATLAIKQGDACQSRAAAFAAARNSFGRERFDRFLYEVIAVNMFSIADRLPDPNLLRQAEEGCR